VLTQRLIALISEKMQEKVVLSFEKNKAAGLDFAAVDAQSSLQLWLAAKIDLFNPPFIIKKYRIINEEIDKEREVCEATISISAGDKKEIFVSDGIGPVNALDLCLKKGLLELFPAEIDIAKIKIKDYAATVFNKEAGSEAKTQVVITFSDGERLWKTAGCHENILFASCRAIQDAYLYPFFLKQISNRLP
jgi:2-isopropylmalate synthase